IEKDERIEDHLLVTQDTATAEKEDLNEQEITLFVPNDPSQINNFVKLKDYESETVHTLDDSGAYLTQKLAQLFEVEPGDTLEIQGDHNENWEVDVAGVVENYIGHTIYMTPAYNEEMTGETNGEPNLE